MNHGVLGHVGKMTSDYGEACLHQLKHLLTLYSKWDDMNKSGHEMWMRSVLTRMKDCIAAGRGEEAKYLAKASLPESMYDVLKDM